MAKLLQLLVLATTACVGYGSFTAERNSGVSMTLDEATLRPMAHAAHSKHPNLHRVKGTAKGLMDSVALEMARAILHFADSSSPDAASGFGHALGKLLASDKAAVAAMEQHFTSSSSGWLDAAHQKIKGAWRKKKLRMHAQAIEDFATGRSSDSEAYEKARDKVTSFLGKFRQNVGASTPIPFEFLPQWRADVHPGAAPVTISGGRCYPSYTASAAYSTTNASFIDITLTAQGSPSSFLCSEQVIFIAGGVQFQFELYGAGTPTKTVTMDMTPVKANPAAEWFFTNNGVRSFVIATDGILSTIGSVVDTLTVLAGFAYISPPANILDANLHFINAYIQGSGKVPRMGPLSVPRPANNSVVENFDPANIESGDLLMLLRRDGIDPMIGWGEGSLAGHSVIAIRTGPTAEELQICETTTADGYWPDNGAQCHSWARWVELCIAAGQNVVLVPLDAEARKKFDTKKALEFFNVNKGIDYGYSSFLFGWLDTARDNFPCTPSSNYTTCLVLEFAEQIAITLDSLFGSGHENFFRQSLAHRSNQWTADPATTPTVLQSIQHAKTKLGMSFGDLIQVVEQDSWMYQTTRNQTKEIVLGKSMVCCVFVCNMWKAGGLFDSLGSNFSCGEQTLWDIYSMKHFDAQRMGDNRPDVCKKADPTNPLCQLMGDITMHLVPDVNTRALYPNMGNKCAALAPEYVRAPGC